MANGSNVDLTALLEQRMTYLNQRQALLSENVANADTPGYKPRDLAPMSFGDTLKQVSVGMAVTDPKHIIPASMSGSHAKSVEQTSIETLPNGNAVDMEQQMLEVSKNSIDYQGITSIYKSISGMFRIALKGS